MGWARRTTIVMRESVSVVLRCAREEGRSAGGRVHREGRRQKPRKMGGVQRMEMLATRWRQSGGGGVVGGGMWREATALG